MTMAGTMSLAASDKSTTSGNTAFDIEGNLQGNFVVGPALNLTSIGNQARGIVITGPITPCVDNAARRLHLRHAGTAAASSGAFANFGSISVDRHHHPQSQGRQCRKRQRRRDRQFDRGRLLQRRSLDLQRHHATATISGNGDIVASSSGTVVLARHR